MSLGILVSLDIVKKKEYTDIKNQYIKLENQQFIFVQEASMVEVYGEKYGISFDLKNENFFNFQYAIRGNKNYGFRIGKNETVQTVFNETLGYQISILKKLDISDKEIKESGYQVVKEVYPLLDKKELKAKNPHDFEQYYLTRNLQKIRISYNKEYLPMKIEGYYDGENGENWYIMREISYPYNTQSEFNQKLDRYVKEIPENEALEED